MRQFAPADEAAVAALWVQVFPHDPPRNEPAGLIARKRARDPDLFWVAQADEDVVGAVVAGYDGVRGWLYHLAVAPSHRGQGIGTALAEHAVAALQELGCIKVNLQVRQGNDGVRRFYEALGWVEDSAISFGRLLAPRGGGASSPR